MYCDEHGTADYCGECMTEAQDQEIAALRQHAEAMAEALDVILRNLEDEDEEGLIGHAEPFQNAKVALSAYRAESAKGGV